MKTMMEEEVGSRPPSPIQCSPHGGLGFTIKLPLAGTCKAKRSAWEGPGLHCLLGSAPKQQVSESAASALSDA